MNIFSRAILNASYVVAHTKILDFQLCWTRMRQLGYLLEEVVLGQITTNKCIPGTRSENLKSCRHTYFFFNFYFVNLFYA